MDLVIAVSGFVLAILGLVAADEYRKKYKALLREHYGDEHYKGCYREVRFWQEMAHEWRERAIASGWKYQEGDN